MQLILWLDDEKRFNALPKSLERLRNRGLEVRLTKNFGPHTKYYPWVASLGAHKQCFVTADDDVIYHSNWLTGLIAARQRLPEFIHCYRARAMQLENGRLLAYSTWPLVHDTQPRHSNFLTGVSGVIYPAWFADYLRDRGEGFLVCCPKADDVWLNVQAIRAGLKVCQIKPEALQLDTIPMTQDTALFLHNQVGGENDKWIKATFTQPDVARLAADFAA